MVKTRKSMEAQTVEVPEPKVGDLPDEKVAAALPDESVSKKPEQVEDKNEIQAPEPAVVEEMAEPKSEVKEGNVPKPAEVSTEKSDVSKPAEVSTEDKQSNTKEGNTDTDTPKTQSEQEEKDQGTKRPVEDVGTTEEIVVAKKLKAVESGDQEVPAKKITCEE